MKIAGFILLGIILLALIITGIGYSLPIQHKATRAATIQASTDDVFRTISNPVEYPKWRSKVTSVEMHPTVNDKLSYTEKGADGDILYVMDEAIASVRMVTRIADEKLPFGGKWTFQLAPSAKGTMLYITEDGEVYNPLFRFMSKYVFGHTASLDTYLSDLQQKFNSK